MLLGKLDSHMQVNKNGTHPHTMHKNKFKIYFEDLNLRQDTIKLLEENTGKISSDINCTNVFLEASFSKKSNLVAKSMKFYA